MSAEDIIASVQKLSGGKPLTISLSGGNPAIQPLGELITLGKAQGYRFALETQGSVAQDWFSDLDVLTLSPKPPSSGEVTDWKKFEECINAAGKMPDITLKIVVFDEEDFIYAQDVAKRYPRLPIYLQVGNHKTNGAVDIKGLEARMRWLVEQVLKDGWFDAKILPQLHVMLWGNKRGV